MICSNCNKDKELVNKHFKLCFFCNNSRLSSKKTDFGIKSKIKKPNKVLEKIKLDEVFYLECFNNSNHECEECGCQLPTEFRDDKGKVIARWRYSHILPKSTYPELRHDINNINNLCLVHHTQWEFGDKTSMKIYDSNRKKFPYILK